MSKSLYYDNLLSEEKNMRSWFLVKYLILQGLLVVVLGAVFVPLSPASLLAHGGKWKCRVKKMDSNRNGIIEKKEMEAFAEKRFQKKDKNKDGVIAEEEMHSCNCLRKRKKEKFQEIDTNKDGKISKEEMLSRFRKKFLEMDSDGNGSITKEEVKLCKSKRKKKK